MFMKDKAYFLFLDPQNEIGPSIYPSVYLCSFVLLIYIVTLVLVFCLCPSSVRVVATFPGTVLFALLCSVLPFFPPNCLKTGTIQLREHTPKGKHEGLENIKVAAPPLDSPCDGPVTYPGDIKTLIKYSKGRSGPTLNMITSLGLTDTELGDFALFFFPPIWRCDPTRVMASSFLRFLDDTQLRSTFGRTPLDE
jgi:hypothetical protein